MTGRPREKPLLSFLDPFLLHGRGRRWSCGNRCQVFLVWAHDVEELKGRVAQKNRRVEDDGFDQATADHAVVKNVGIYHGRHALLLFLFVFVQPHLDQPGPCYFGGRAPLVAPQQSRGGKRVRRERTHPFLLICAVPG